MNEKKGRIIFQILFVLVSVIAIEICLRKMGYQPGDMKPNWLNFHPVDSLYVIHDFYTNNEGILVADSVYWAKEKVSINPDGFRSPNLSALESNKKKILFIGDSFTWGASASPITDNCFVDLIRNETNYEVINLGIPAADPVQYNALAQKYLPKIKPDYLLVIFFMGNDLMKNDRKIIPGEPFYYFTSAGALLADIDGIHFKNPKAAYNYFTNDKYYLHQPKNFFEKVVSKSSLLSRLYSVRFRIQEKLEYEHMVNHTRITKNYLYQIKECALKNHVPLKFVLIPEIKEVDMPIERYRKRYQDILGDSILKDDWLITQNVKANFNDYPDGHLNNTGHRFYADFLKAFLKNLTEHK